MEETILNLGNRILPDRSGSYALHYDQVQELPQALLVHRSNFACQPSSSENSYRIEALKERGLVWNAQ